jgi:DHA1 family tetracycline resistance protein-like MFS transporter
MTNNKAITVILITILLDAIGIGLIMPILPDLLRDLVHSDQIAGHYGILLSLYALMQFLCTPILGALSDRFGRRPVLLLSLAGATIDYTIMATAPGLFILYVGRIIAGITSATGAVASAYIADITEGEERARRFGFMSACFGIGMTLGPTIGGLVGTISPRAPFMVAAALNGVNLLTGYFLLPESHLKTTKAISIAILNPLTSLRWAYSLKILTSLMVVFFIIQLVGQVPATLWVLFCEERFQWDAMLIGLSLTWFGLLHALAQAFLTGRVTKWLGEKGSLLLGMCADGIGYILLAFATEGRMVLPIMFLLALGGIGTPALQAVLSNKVSEEDQGQLQGSLASLTSCTSIIGPLVFSTLYLSSLATWNGLSWVVGAALYLVCLPRLYRLTTARV